jgi:hypothetical protein
VEHALVWGSRFWLDDLLDVVPPVVASFSDTRQLSLVMKALFKQAPTFVYLVRLDQVSGGKVPALLANPTTFAVPLLLVCEEVAAAGLALEEVGLDVLPAHDVWILWYRCGKFSHNDPAPLGIEKPIAAGFDQSVVGQVSHVLRIL